MLNCATSSVLVTGANGFLGKFTVNKLLQNGFIVYACGQENKLTYKHPNLHFLHLNLRVNEIEDILGSLHFNSVVHLASSVPSFSSDQSFASQNQYLEGVYLPTLRLLKILKNKTNHLVLASTVCVYGAVSGDVSETQGCRPTDYYGMYKWFAEELCQQYSNGFGVKLSILRFTQLYGPGEPHGIFLQRVFLQHAREGKPVNLVRGGKDKKDLLWVEDAADAIVSSVINSSEGIFNIANGCAVSIKQIAEMLRSLSGDTLAVNIGEDDYSNAVSFSFSIEKAKNIIGFNPVVSIHQGLEKLYKAG